MTVVEHGKVWADWIKNPVGLRDVPGPHDKKVCRVEYLPQREAALGVERETTVVFFPSGKLLKVAKCLVI